MNSKAEKSQVWGRPETSTTFQNKDISVTSLKRHIRKQWKWDNICCVVLIPDESHKESSQTQTLLYLQGALEKLC